MILGAPPSENFIKQIPMERESMPRGFYKAIILDSLSVISAGVFSYSYYAYLAGKASFWFPTIALAVFLIFSILETILIKNLKRRTLVVVLEIAALFAFFYTLPSGLLVTAMGVSLLFSVWGEINARAEIANTMEPNYFKVARARGAKLVSAVVLMVIIIYFPKFNVRENFISRATFDGFFSWTAGVVEKIYPGVNLRGTITDFAEDLAFSQTQKIPGFEALPVPIQEKTTKEAAKVILQNISTKVKTDAKPSESVSDVAYSIVTSNIERLKNEHSAEFRLVWTILLFLAVRSFGVILVPIIAIIIYVLIHLMLALNFIFVAGETRTKETLTL